MWPDWWRRAVSQSGTGGRRGHHHHPQDTAWSRGGLILPGPIRPGEEIQLAGIPRHPGRPLMHAIAAKAVAFKEALQPEFKDYSGR